MHTGDSTDPRVSLIEVVPSEVRYWLATEGTLRRTVEITVDAALGRTSSPGELRTIAKEEVSGVRHLSSLDHLLNENRLTIFWPSMGSLQNLPDAHMYVD